MKKFNNMIEIRKPNELIISVIGGGMILFNIFHNMFMGIVLAWVSILTLMSFGLIFFSMMAIHYWNPSFMWTYYLGTRIMPSHDMLGVKNVELREESIKWVHQNVRSWAYWYFADGSTLFLFKQDAMRFKLIYG